MRVVWSERALSNIEAVGDYLAQHNPGARARILDADARRVTGLAAHPFQGRVGQVARTRELVVTRTPYVVAYRVEHGIVEILAVIDGRRKWPKRFSRKR